MTQKISAIGIPWYHEEDYPKIKTIMADSQQLHDTYKQWLQAVNSTFNDFKIKGYIVEKVYIDADSFPAWCFSRGLNIDANARMAFANDFVGRKYGN